MASAPSSAFSDLADDMLSEELAILGVGDRTARVDLQDSVLTESFQRLAVGDGTAFVDLRAGAVVEGFSVLVLRDRITLVNLPDDILTSVFNILPLGDRIALRRTCKRLQTLHDSSVRLAYRLALDADGLVDVVPSSRRCGPDHCSADVADIEGVEIEMSTAPPDMTPWEAEGVYASATALATANRGGPRCSTLLEDSHKTTSERAKMLREVNAHWETLWLSSPFLVKYSLPSAYYSHRLAGDSLIATPVHLIKSMPTVVIPLPRHPNEPRMWGGLARSVIVDAVDVGQDLAVVIEWGRVDLRSLATGEPHPAAACPQLFIHDMHAPPPTPFPRDFFFEPEVDNKADVLGSTLLLKVKTPDDISVELTAWNWRSGQRIGGRLELLKEPAAWNAYLLTPTAVVVAHTCEPIRYDRVPGRERRDAHLELFSVARDGAAMYRIAYLALPQQARNVTLTTENDRSLLLSSNCADDTIAALRSSQLFQPSWRRGIVRLHCQIHCDVGITSLDIYILRERLVAIVEEGEQRLAAALQHHSADENVACRTYRWEEWGGRIARVIHPPSSTRVRRAAGLEDEDGDEGGRWLTPPGRMSSFAGYRDAELVWCCDVPLPERNAETYDLIVRDFSPAAVARARERRDAAGATGDSAVVIQQDGSEVTVRLFEGASVIEAQGRDTKMDVDGLEIRNDNDEGSFEVDGEGAWAWAEDVRSALPYVETRRRIGRLPCPDRSIHPRHELIMDARRIVVTCTNHARGDTTVEALVFNL